MIIAITIVSISVLTFSRVFFTEYKAGGRNKNRLEALIIAENYMEQFRADRDKKRFNSASTMKIYLGSIGFIDNGTLLSKKEKITNIEYNVKIYIDGSNDRLIQVMVEVLPPDSNAIRVGTKLYMDKIIY